MSKNSLVFVIELFFMQPFSQTLYTFCCSCPRESQPACKSHSWGLCLPSNSWFSVPKDFDIRALQTQSLTLPCGACRYWQQDAWQSVFSSLLNAPSCDDIPDLAQVRCCHNLVPFVENYCIANPAMCLEAATFTPS